jgi:hypothetical protein
MHTSHLSQTTKRDEKARFFDRKIWGQKNKRRKERWFEISLVHLPATARESIIEAH